MKSLSVSVFWPAWCWLREPGLRWLFSSYSHGLSVRDSVKCRRIIQSTPYQKILQETQPDFILTGDQNTKLRYENSYGGVRLATSVDGANTGEGGDIIVVDDAHNVAEGESDAARQSVLEWWDEVMATRLNDQKTGAYVIMMQRVHEMDLSGHVLAKSNEYDHLCLPARFEGENRVRSSLGFKDPRKEEGEPLWPERFGDKELKQLEASLGQYAAAGQLYQRPSPRKGGMIPVDRFQFLETEAYKPSQVEAFVRYWDKAGTQDGGKYTAGVLMARMRGGKQYVILDVVRGQWSAGTREEKIHSCAVNDNPPPDSTLPRVTTWVEQEPGSGGKESAENTLTSLRGFSAHADRVTGDKVTRSEPFATQVEVGNIYLLRAPWNHDFVRECQLFPKGRFKDQVDAASGAFNKLVVKRRIAGVF